MNNASSKPDLIKKIEADYKKKLKDLEAKLAVYHKELNQIEQSIAHKSHKTVQSNLSELKSRKIELNGNIAKLKKEIKKITKEKVKRLKKM